MALTKITTNVITDDSITSPLVGAEFTTSAAVSSSATENIDWTSAQIFTLTPSQSTTLNVTNPVIGIQKTFIITEAAASTRTKQAHTISNATTGALTLSTTPSPNTTSYVDLYISGVYQVASSYTLSGTTLTLAGGTFFPQGAAVETIALS